MSGESGTPSVKAFSGFCYFGRGKPLAGKAWKKEIQHFTSFSLRPRYRLRARPVNPLFLRSKLMTFGTVFVLGWRLFWRQNDRQKCALFAPECGRLLKTLIDR